MIQCSTGVNVFSQLTIKVLDIVLYKCRHTFLLCGLFTNNNQHQCFPFESIGLYLDSKQLRKGIGGQKHEIVFDMNVS